MMGSVFGLVLEHGVEDAGQLVSGGGDGFRFAQAGAHGAVVAAQATLGMGQGLGCQAQDSSRSGWCGGFALRGTLLVLVGRLLG